MTQMTQMTQVSISYARASTTAGPSARPSYPGSWNESAQGRKLVAIGGPGKATMVIARNDHPAANCRPQRGRSRGHQGTLIPVRRNRSDRA